MSQPPLLTVKAWGDAAQSNPLINNGQSIQRVESVTRDLNLSMPHEYHVLCDLYDPLTQEINKQNYLEVYRGRFSPGVWANGVVTEINKDADQGTIEFVLSSPLIMLANINNGGTFAQPYANYPTLREVLNGAHPSGQPAYPGQFGILDGTGWEALWATYKTTTGDPAWPQTWLPTMGTGGGEWGTSLQNLTSVANIYTLYFREQPGSKPYHGQIYFGPLSDPSGVAIWGGDSLAQKLNLPAGHRALAAAAQAAGLNQITDAKYQETSVNVKNLVWALGAGTGKTLCTLGPIFGDVFKADGKTLEDGITLFNNPNPQGMNYYIKANDQQSWQGHTYTLVACQDQEPGTYRYGLMDLTSVSLYGVLEAWHHFKKVKDPGLLLAGAIGFLQKRSDPPPMWEFTVDFPYQDTPPPVCLPGQTVNVNFAGMVLNATKVGTDGQPTDVGPYEYMQFPNLGTRVPDIQMAYNVSRVVKITDTIDATGYTATYTMGTDAKKPTTQTMNVDLARRFVDVAQAVTTHSWHHQDWKEIQWDMTNGVYGSGNNLIFPPGGMAMAITPDDTYLIDNHAMRFSFNLPEPTSCFWFIFAKPRGKTVRSLDITGQSVSYLPKSGKPQYGIVQICGGQYPGQCGFHTTTDGVTLTKHGIEPNKRMFTNGMRMHVPKGGVNLTLHVTMSGGKFEAWLHKNAEGGSPDNVSDQDLMSYWLDHDKELAIQGTVGFYMPPFGNIPLKLWGFVAHPQHSSGRPSQGGSGKHGSAISDGGQIIRATDPNGNNFAPVVHNLGADGKPHHRDESSHGPFGDTSAVISTITFDGSNVTIMFARPVNASTGLQSGMLVVDQRNNWCSASTILTVKRGGTTSITGFITQEVEAAQLMFAGDSIMWDPLDSVDQPPAVGHRRTGIYMPDEGGWGVMDIPADGSEDQGFVVSPNGKLFTLGGAKPLTQADGSIISLASLAVDGANLAKAAEHDGAALFDAGEIDSSTQYIDAYRGTTGNLSAITPSIIVGNDPTAFTDLTQGPTTMAGTWVSKTATNVAGKADAILALTPGTWKLSGTINDSFAVAYDTVVWHDHAITLIDGSNRVYTVRRDSSFTFPIYVSAASGGNAGSLLLGAHATVDRFVGSIMTVKESVSYLTSGVNGGANSGLGIVQTSKGDVWAIPQPDGSVVSMTVSSVDYATSTITFTSVPAAFPAPGTKVYAVTMRNVAGTLTAVNSGMQLDGTYTSAHVKSTIDAIAVGFYALDLSSLGGTLKFDWFRCYWGTPNWQPQFLKETPYVSGNTYINFMGPVPTNPSGQNDFVELLAKASDLVNNNGIPLFQPGTSPKYKIVGVELAAYSAVPGTGVTVYFDGHEHGAMGSAPDNVPSGIIGGPQLRPLAVTAPAKDPTSNADAHQYNDIDFWMDKNNQLHWTTGTFVSHNGTKANINGASAEESPNTGINGLVVGKDPSSNVTVTQTGSPGGNYLMLNTTGSAILVYDPYGGGINVTVPAYSANGGTGGQTIGFAMLSGGYDFTHRVGGGGVKKGLPPGLVKVGKFDTTPDPGTNALHLKGWHGAGKQGSDNTQNGAIIRAKKNLHDEARQVAQELMIVAVNSDVTEQGYVGTATDNLTPGANRSFHLTGLTSGALPGNTAVKIGNIAYIDSGTSFEAVTITSAGTAGFQATIQKNHSGTYSVVVPGTCDLTWQQHTIQFDDGTTLAVPQGSAPGVHGGMYVGIDLTSNGSFPLSTFSHFFNFSAVTAVQYAKIGKVSLRPDTYSGQYTLKTMRGQEAQTHGEGTADGSQHPKHHHPSVVIKGHFKNLLAAWSYIDILGNSVNDYASGTGTFPQTLNFNSTNGSAMKFVQRNASSVTLAGGQNVLVNGGEYLMFGLTPGGTNFHKFFLVSPAENLDSPNSAFHKDMCLGYFGDAVDPVTLHPTFHSYYHGFHVTQGPYVDYGAVGALKVNWRFTNDAVASYLQVNGDNTAQATNSYNTWLLNNYLSATLPMNQRLYNAIHSNGWAVAFGEGTSRPSSPYVATGGSFPASYSQPLGPPQSLAGSAFQTGPVGQTFFPNMQYADSSGLYGGVVLDVQITPTLFTMYFQPAVWCQPITFGQTGVKVWPWIQISGMSNS